MTITDKTRKILWGGSGKLCAICRQQLVVDETELDAESVVGDECHIISGAPAGPRHRPGISEGELDAVVNLILLCKVHHKMIDDQHETYTVELLHSIKHNHEKWVRIRLKDEENPPPVRIRRTKDQIPTKLPRVESGALLVAMINNCAGSYQDHSADLTDEEVELVGGFLQEVQDYADIGAELEPLEQLRSKKRIDDQIRELDAHGFYVFAATEMQRLEGDDRTPSPWKVLHISVMRKDDARVVHTGEPD